MPPSLAVRIHVPDDKCLLALRCDDHIAGLFTHAWSLLCTFVDPKSLKEDCGDNELLQHQLQNAGSAWNDHRLILTGSAWNGHTGLRSVGVGSTVKKILRPARLAFAALLACGKEKVALDPTADGAWGTLLHCVRGSVLAAPGSMEGWRDGVWCL